MFVYTMSYHPVSHVQIPDMKQCTEMDYMTDFAVIRTNFLLSLIIHRLLHDFSHFYLKLALQM
jgi:hypothetical protein